MFTLPKFYGHGVSNLIFDVFMALLAPLSMWGFIWSIQTKRVHKVFLLPIGLAALLLMPNACYLAFELRHLFLIDNVADDLQPAAILVFSLLATFGLALTIFTVLLAASLPYFRKYRMTAIIVLCFLSGLGTAYGYLDYNSWDAMFSPEIIFRAMHEVSESMSLQCLTFGLTIGLSILSITADHVYNRILCPEGRKVVSATVQIAHD